jgi:hypothetical protein
LKITRNVDTVQFPEKKITDKRDYSNWEGRARVVAKGKGRDEKNKKGLG